VMHFEVVWTGENEEPTIESRKQLLNTSETAKKQSMIALIKRTKQNFTAGQKKFVKLLGKSSVKLVLPDYSTETLFHDEEKSCLPFSLLNVIGSSERFASALQQKLGKGLFAYCDAKIFADICCTSFGICLERTIDLGPLQSRVHAVTWLLNQQDGNFIMINELHCISVNCRRKRVYDCRFKNPFYLTEATLQTLGFAKFDELRRVQLPPKFRSHWADHGKYCLKFNQMTKPLTVVHFMLGLILPSKRSREIMSQAKDITNVDKSK
jgi:hypothetical protein